MPAVNHVTGDDGVNILLGGAGVDHIIGMGASDFLISFSDDDVLKGGDGFDKLFADSGNDVLLGGDGEDKVNGGSGDDRMYGDGYGGGGGDALGFDDWMHGSSGNDYLQAGGGNDLVFGGLDDDTVLGGAGNDIVFGDRFGGGAGGAEGGSDLVDGGQGSDYVQGGAGDDIGRWSASGNFGFQDFYDGGADIDTLLLQFTDAQWTSLNSGPITISQDLDDFEVFLLAETSPITGEASGAVFSFQSVGLDVMRFEAVEVQVDGITIDTDTYFV
jgi:Ca2+-binding RTX toxin-like protein